MIRTHLKSATTGLATEVSAAKQRACLREQNAVGNAGRIVAMAQLRVFFSGLWQFIVDLSMNNGDFP